MFYIEDGREHFYQWDVDRRLVVDDPTIKEVHFCNRTGECSLVCEVYFHDNDFGGIYVANVPNILLQSDWKIHVFAYDGKHTRYDASYEVKSRTKPADYVYTETEVLNYNTLLERIETIEEKEVDVDLSNYYTKPEVDEMVENVDVDLTGYVKKTDYADVTKPGIIAYNPGFGLGKSSSQNLYITRANETEIDDRENHYKPIVPSNLEYAVKSVSDGYYVKNTDLKTAKVNYADYAGYVDAAPYADIAEIAFKDENNNKIIDTYATKEELADYAKTADLSKANVAYAESANYALYADCDVDGNDITLHYASKEYVDDAIANIPTGGGSGGEVKNYYIADYMNLTEEDITVLTGILKNDERDWYITTSVGFMTGIKKSDLTHLSFYIFSHDMSMYWSGYFSSTTNKIVLNYINSIATQHYVDNAIGGGGSSWSYTTDISDSGLYNANEVYIMGIDGEGNFIFSYVYLGAVVLGDCRYNNYYFAGNTSDYWYYDGSSIQVSGASSIYTIGYK